MCFFMEGYFSQYLYLQQRKTFTQSWVLFSVQFALLKTRKTLSLFFDLKNPLATRRLVQFVDHLFTFALIGVNCCLPSQAEGSKMTICGILDHLFTFYLGGVSCWLPSQAEGSKMTQLPAFWNTCLLLL